MAGALDGPAHLSLMGGAQASFCSGADLPQTGNVVSQEKRFLEINILDVLFAQIALHSFYFVKEALSFKL